MTELLLCLLCYVLFGIVVGLVIIRTDHSAEDTNQVILYSCFLWPLIICVYAATDGPTAIGRLGTAYRNKHYYKVDKAGSDS